MGYEFHKLSTASRDFIAAIPDSPTPLKSLWDHHQNEKILSLGKSNFIISTSKVFTLLNPCYVYWNELIAVTWRTEPETFRVVLIDRRNGSTSLSAEAVEADINFMRTFNFLDAAVPHLSMKGEDPRLIVTQDLLDPSKQRLWVVFCKRYHRQRPELQMSFAEVILKDGAPMAELTTDINFNNERPREDQKNWSPFVANRTSLLFVTSTDPHRIVTSVPVENKPGKSFGKTVALTNTFPSKNKLWKHGELRGGTPAVLIGNGDRYLSFFHSSNDPPNAGDVLKTYVMGAYTFCARPPHRVLGLSRLPLVHESMYTGPWTDLPTSYYHIDYVVFPMSFVITDAQPTSAQGDGRQLLYLTYGKQDNQGWVAVLDYRQLLDSLVVVNESCE